MAAPQEGPRFGPFGTSFLVLLFLGVLLFMGLLWTRSCGSDDEALSAPEQLEVDDVRTGE